MNRILRGGSGCFVHKKELFLTRKKRTLKTIIRILRNICGQKGISTKAAIAIKQLKNMTQKERIEALTEGEEAFLQKHGIPPEQKAISIQLHQASEDRRIITSLQKKRGLQIIWHL